MLRPSRAIPELAFPFAVVGLAAGWLSAGLLANPLVGLSLRPERTLAAGLAMLAGAGVGALLTWRCVRSPEERVRGQLVASVVVGGAVTGAVVGSAEAGLARGLPAGVIHGALCGAAFIPICALVVAAARRAVRARMGSIVAGSDARAVWAILAAALSVATLAALPDWPASRMEWTSYMGNMARRHAAGVALAFAAGAALLIAAILAKDAIALARVTRLARKELEPHELEEGAANGEVPATDLGLGEEVRAQVARGVAYRSRDRAVALLVGSADQARSALRRALLRGAAGLAIAVAAVAVHVWVARSGADLAYAELRCAQRGAVGCVEAGQVFAAKAEGDLGSVSASRARALFERACASGDGRGCAELSRLLEGHPFEAAAARKAGEVACVTGVAERCRAVGLAISDHDPAAAASLLRTGCGWGDAESCRLAPELGDRAARRAAIPRR